MTAVGGASAVPAGGGSSLLLPGGFGHQPAGTMTGREVLAVTGAGARREFPANLWCLSREAWPEAEPWDA